jgi:hypothetical protein
MTNLRLIVSNDLPVREETYPCSWLLYKSKKTIEVHVRHDSPNRPVVIDKVVA